MSWKVPICYIKGDLSILKWYSSGPNTHVVPNKHVGWTVSTRLISVWSWLIMWGGYLSTEISKSWYIIGFFLRINKNEWNSYNGFAIDKKKVLLTDRLMKCNLSTLANFEPSLKFSSKINKHVVPNKSMLGGFCLWNK